MTRNPSEELRAWNRKVFAWSYAIAALVLGALFLWSPTYRVGPLKSAEVQGGAAEPTAMTPMFVRISFGPPDIFLEDGTVSREPEDRVLEVDRVVELPTECEDAYREESLPASGEVRLRVPSSGRAEVVEVSRSAGDACGDRLITTVADALRYHWLPDERFPAPVELLQPVTVWEVSPAL